VADRIWDAWWRPDGLTLDDVRKALGEVVAASGFPFTLVAVEGGRFLGTVTAIMSDVEGRPDIGPCIAALWVEPEARGSGVGREMTRLALARLRGVGFNVAYLSARERMRAYYLAGGWQLAEQQVGRDSLDIFHTALEPSP